ncbi:thioredoxin family protein [Clostridium sp.]|uniref:thioredoxin family protein n=1 Tax=Clostridium sp. TaxID=1506 RepID=UPI003D6D4B94
MLETNLKHIQSKDEFQKIIETNENTMVCCGRMGPMCLPVYAVMEEIGDEYKNVNFFDMDFDIPDANVIKNLPECKNFRGLPFTVYYKNGKIVKATTSIQSKEQVTNIIEKHFV